jgi:hypothetical protein
VSSVTQFEDMMANEQQEREDLSWKKYERTQVPTTTAKPSWQIARDISMDILSKKATQLSLKQGTYREL